MNPDIEKVMSEASKPKSNVENKEDKAEKDSSEIKPESSSNEKEKTNLNEPIEKVPSITQIKNDEPNPIVFNGSGPLNDKITRSLNTPRCV